MTMAMAKLESAMDMSIGSDGDRSNSSFGESPCSSTVSPTSDLKFSISNILAPSFGNKATVKRVQPENLGKHLGLPSFASLCTPPTSLTLCAPPAPPNIITSVVAAALHHQQQKQLLQQEKKQLSPVSSIGSLNSPTTPKSLLSPSTPTSGAVTTTTPSDGSSKTPAALWPAWVFCTRYSDRPSSGPRCRRIKRKTTPPIADEKRPRTAFTGEQLNRLKHEFQENRYLTEKRRHELAHELGLNESQIKIWFQNKRAKIKKQTGQRNSLALHLMAQGLYNHSTVPIIETGDDDEDDDNDRESAADDK